MEIIQLMIFVVIFIDACYRKIFVHLPALRTLDRSVGYYGTYWSFITAIVPLASLVKLMPTPPSIGIQFGSGPFCVVGDLNIDRKLDFVVEE